MGLSPEQRAACALEGRRFRNSLAGSAHFVVRLVPGGWEAIQTYEDGMYVWGKSWTRSRLSASDAIMEHIKRYPFTFDPDRGTDVMVEIDADTPDE